MVRGATLPEESPLSWGSEDGAARTKEASTVGKCSARRADGAGSDSTEKLEAPPRLGLRNRLPWERVNVPMGSCLTLTSGWAISGFPAMAMVARTDVMIMVVRILGDRC